mmetsp:Transcript_29402/g.87194  ORF Transcript_29402/g.87194 Transcript_29402/m.87194 type:complete len:103 (-) Transcript_29402:342-650(-)
MAQNCEHQDQRNQPGWHRKSKHHRKNIIKDLICNSIILVPAAFDPFMRPGDASRRYTSPKRIPHPCVCPYFSQSDGSDAGYLMSQDSRQDNVTGLFNSADTG